jgi:RNA polymerase sigma factor (sigma-70 family)
MSSPSPSGSAEPSVRMTPLRVSAVEVVWPDCSDADVARGIAEGSAEALRLAFQRWGSLIHTIAFRALGDPHDAEEVTQQVFVSAWSSRRQLKPSPEALPGWLVGIAKHRIADLRRMRMRADRRVAAAHQMGTRTSTTLDDRVAERLVLAYELERLGDPRAAILRMAFVEDLPQAEIAAQLKLPLNTVKSHVRRGLAELRQRLEEVSKHG